MKHASLLRRGASAVVALMLMVGLAMGQNIVIGASAGTITNTGTINVKGNIDNTAAVADVTFSGTVNLVGTSAQSIGGSANAVNFATLAASGGTTKTLNTNSTVSTTISSTGASTAVSLATGKKLTLGGSITSASGGAYTFNASNAEVDYAGTGSQSMYSTTYDKLTMSGSGGFTLAGDITANNTVNQSGSGALTVDNNLTASAGYTFGTISTIAASKALTLSATGGTIATLTDIAATGQLVNGSGTLTVSTLSDNHGTITASAGGGAITFTNGATNTGAITGGAGLITFSSTLSHSTGTITSGAGGVQFDGSPTLLSTATITSAAGTLDFNAAVIGTSGTISLTGTGVANFANTFSTVPTLSFASGTTVNYDGAGQDVPAASYGYLNMKGSGTKLALGNITVNNDFDNGGSGNNTVTTDMSTFALAITGAKDNTSSTMKFGGTVEGTGSNGVLFATGTVDYNAGSGTQLIAGDAALKYASLTLSGGGTKRVSTGAANTVWTTSGLGVNTGVLLDIVSGGILNVDGDLTINGDITNAGTVTVGP